MAFYDLYDTHIFTFIVLWMECTSIFLIFTSRFMKLYKVHCEKSLFVLASRQKILVLRTENPTVDTRTICLLPIEFFKLPMPEKLRLENPGQKQQIRPENPGLLVPER